MNQSTSKAIDHSEEYLNESYVKDYCVGCHTTLKWSVDRYIVTGNFCPDCNRLTNENGIKNIRTRCSTV